MHFVWDNQDEANEFVTLYEDHMQAKYASTPVTPSDWGNAGSLWEATGRATALDIKGAETWVVIGPDKTTVTAAGDALSKALAAP